MAHIRTWQDIIDRGGDDWLTEAEKKLIAACKAGEKCVLEDGKLPPEGTPTSKREIRADVLRYLLLGGCDNCQTDDIGVWISGAHITGALDVDFCTVKGAMQLEFSLFDHELSTLQTTVAMIDLSDGHMQGWFGQRLICNGSIYLRRITAEATVDLNSATIGGQLACDDAQLNAKDGHALNAQGAKVTDSVFLRKITANATVDLNSATIGGQLACNGAQLNATGGHALNAQGAKVTDHVFLRKITANATVDLNSATIGGQLDCNGAHFNATDGHALNAQSIQIGEGLIWREVQVSSASLDFNSAHLGVLADDEASWPDGNLSQLDGMRYDRISGNVSAKSRLAWLAKGSHWVGDFFPQPYTQLAKVLRDMGHDTDARKILAERERQLVISDCAQRAQAGGRFARPLNIWFRFWGLILRITVGYGHRPFRSILVLVTLIIIAIAPSHFAWEEGSFAPNSAVIQSSEGWKGQLVSQNPARAWSADNQAGQDWETFNAIAYGVDVVIPIINFGQTEAWAPSTNRGWWGKQVYWLRWVLASAGWIVTALGAAAITGLIRRD